MTTRKPRNYRPTATMELDGGGTHVGWNATATHEKYVLTTTWRTVAGRPEAVCLCIGHVDGIGVTANRVRQLPLGEMINASRKAIAGTATVLAAFQEQHAGRPRQAARTRDAWDSVGPQRGRSATAEELAEVAAVYQQAWEAGESVNKAVRMAFRPLSSSGAGKRIMAARKAGLLKGVGPR